MSEKTRKKCRCLLMGACIALGIYFGAYRLGLIPLFNLLYCRQYGMLTMLHAIECILCISAAVIITASSGLLGLAISWLFGFDGKVRLAGSREVQEQYVRRVSKEMARL